MFQENWKKGLIMCKLSMLWLYVCSGVHIMSNVAMIVDRSLGITKPMQREKLANSRKHKWKIEIKH